MVEDGKRAYSALLTLLDDGSGSQKRVKKITNNSEPRPSNASEASAVEGYENNEQEEEEEEIQAEDDNEGDSKDPYESHFASPPSFNEPSQWESSTVNTLPLLGTRSLFVAPKPTVNILGDSHESLIPLRQREAFAKLKHRLQAPFTRTNGPEFTPLQENLARPLFQYQDALISNRTWGNSGELLNLLALHLINHIYKTRDRVLKNNAKIRDESDTTDLDKFRDQGFTRAKVLVLLPTRNAAYEFLNRVSDVSGLSQAENRKRFKDAFYSQGADLRTKPSDFQRLYAGNTNEVFTLGVKFTRQALKLYSSFYNCDLIVASPLGLRLIIDKKDFDFLSSIEICAIDQVDAVAMQSWTNVRHIFDVLNSIPKNPHDCDFSRIRDWYLDEKAKFLRQTILISEFTTPEMLSLFNKKCLNVGGKVRGRLVYEGTISSLGIRVSQMFTRINAVSVSQDSQQRLNHFTTSVLPSLLRGSDSSGILVIAPTYSDFVVLRNYLEKHDYSYVSLSEYSSAPQLSRGRKFFADGKAKIMLYSIRLHHYRRYNIKGARTIVFYGLPDNPLFYKEIVRGLARTAIEQHVDPDLLRVNNLFSKWDALKLERIVGTRRMGPLIEGRSETHEFY